MLSAVEMCLEEFKHRTQGAQKTELGLVPVQVEGAPCPLRAVVLPKWGK